ncbi:hypothetical protein B9Z19DRAFT_739204 [Tuber borchii]|uniref:Uncharacterized protein n=1 Tax=Tuber borchii TaxID=42251 RepID=A0A2T6ZXZ4_TUBBO|nr:hypothetical protein B9Z19DRAFT_739204 [Tuber borchii]
MTYGVGELAFDSRTAASGERAFSSSPNLSAQLGRRSYGSCADGLRNETRKIGARGGKRGRKDHVSLHHPFICFLPPSSLHPLFSFFFSHCPPQKPKKESEREKKKKKYAKGSNLETNVYRMINCHADAGLRLRVIFPVRTRRCLTGEPKREERKDTIYRQPERSAGDPNKVIQYWILIQKTQHNQYPYQLLYHGSEYRLNFVTQF